MSQVKSGKAFEYGMLKRLEQMIKCEIEKNSALQIGEDYYNNCTDEEQSKILKASDEIVFFLSTHDKRLVNGEYKACLQSDMKGKEGDVRDIVLRDTKGLHEIGLSLKNRHSAVKHSRLSERIDFGKEWIGISNSQEYKNKITPIFRELRNRKTRKELWRDIEDKGDQVYIPILYAFRDELLRIHALDSGKVSSNLLSYMIGKHDFYKVIKENGTVSAQSFNVFGSLGWGSKISLPKRIIEADVKEHSKTTLIVVFDCGWQISFRIHNASSKVEPSLKFDIQIVGWPSILSRHVIDYLNA